jgi:hypothetical protein
MTVFTGSTDTVVHVYEALGSTQVGHASAYTTKEHPGTSKQIEGWEWDKRTWPEPPLEEGLSYVPSVWDPTISGLSESYFQSGYGDNNDLLLLGFDEVVSSGLELWAPKIYHGHFYVHDEEWYLFSDTYQTEYFSSATTISGMQYLDLSLVPKAGIPILVQNYEFDDILGRYRIKQSYRKVVEFTSVSGFSEFRMDTSVSPPRLWMDGIYTEKVGESLALVSGVLGSQEAMEALDFIGVSDGSAGQAFNLTYSPVDPDADVQVWVYQGYATPQEYETVSGENDFVSSGYQVILDKDLGVLRFGDWDGSSGAGMIPPAGYRISTHYTRGIAVHYEPQYTQNDLLALTANVNPVTASTGKGFVQVSTLLGDPASIELASELPTASPTYVIDLGNNTGKLVATVKDAWGRTLEGEQVTFSIQDPQVGTFGGVLTSVSSTTDGNGQARAIYNSPLTISDIGRVTTSVSWEGVGTKVTVDDMTTPTAVSGVYLYKVHSYDEVLGIPASGLTPYYEDYLTGIEAVSGVQGTPSFEAEYRTEQGLSAPVTYTAGNTSIGKKSLVITQKPLADRVLNTKTGALDANVYSPLYPATVTETGTASSPQFELVYSGVNLPLPEAAPPVDADTAKAYFVVADTNTTVQASVLNKRTGGTINSNEITLRTQIPASANGTYVCNTLSALPSGLLTKVQDVTAMTDDEILAYSGVQYDNYLDERTGSYSPVYGQWTVDDHTIGLWHLDQDLTEEVGLDDASNYGMSPTANGFADGGYEATASGQWLQASGIFGIQNVDQGTLEFYFKAKYPDGLGDQMQVMNFITWGHPTDDSLLNVVALWFWDTFGTTDPKLSAFVNIGGDTPGGTWLNTPGNIRQVLDTLGGRDEWHHYKVVWEVDVPSARVGLFIDDKKFIDTSGPVSGWSPGPERDYFGNQAFVLAGQAERLTRETASGIYDEIRISNTARWDQSGLPVVDLTFSGQNFVEWFKETRRSDTETVGLEEVLASPDAPFEVPLGWRLRDSGVTIASAIDQVTYLDPNSHLASGYYD